MNDLGKNILSIAGYIFAGLLVIFTGIQTYALLFEVSASHVTAAIGLILFEAGMIYWWSVFRREAAGLTQMAISGIMFSVSLLFVTAAVALHLGAINIDFLGPATPARVIVIAALLNLVAKLVYPLVHPDMAEEINDRAQEGKLLKQAEQLYNKKVDDLAAELADDMAEIRATRARAKVYEDYTTRLNRRIPVLSTNGRDELEVVPVAYPNGHSPKE